jgi:hypothetical protein
LGGTVFLPIRTRAKPHVERFGGQLLVPASRPDVSSPKLRRFRRRRRPATRYFGSSVGNSDSFADRTRKTGGVIVRRLRCYETSELPLEEGGQTTVTGWGAPHRLRTSDWRIVRCSIDGFAIRPNHPCTIDAPARRRGACNRRLDDLDGSRTFVSNLRSKVQTSGLFEISFQRFKPAEQSPDFWSLRDKLFRVPGGRSGTSFFGSTIFRCVQGDPSIRVPNVRFQPAEQSPDFWSLRDKLPTVQTC